MQTRLCRYNLLKLVKTGQCGTASLKGAQLLKYHIEKETEESVGIPRASLKILIIKQSRYRIVESVSVFLKTFRTIAVAQINFHLRNS